MPLTHENLCVSADNIVESVALTSGDRCLNIMPLFHVHGLVGAVLSSLSVGASVVCTPGYKVTEFFGWLAEFHPTWYTGVPTMHHGILSRTEANRAIIAANPMRFIRSCSAALAPKIMAQLEEVFAVPVLEAYGMTEAAHQMSCNGLPPRARKPGSVGRPTGVEVAIMNDANALLPVDSEGEVVIRGRNVTHGYENNPDANLKSFTDGWFRTGDQGRFDSDGDLFLTGRIKELIVRGGEKIPPREIDEALLSHPEVDQALAFALPDEVLGEKVAAAVVLKAGAFATELELSEHAARSLSDFKVPEKIIFVAELPKGPTGKPQRIGLAEKLGLKVQVEAPVESRAEYCAPRNDTETGLAETWCAVLKLERAGIHDNFFDCGGDSVLASQLIARLRHAFGVDLSLPRFFQLPTIAELAEFIAEQSSGKAEDLTLPLVSRTDGVVLTSAQQRMYFLSQLEPDSPVYNCPFAYRLKGSLDLPRLRQALADVIKRHEILRTNYRDHVGVIEGIVREAKPVSVAFMDMSSLADAQLESATADWMREESARLFNLATGPVLRCSLARLSSEEHILLMVIHHIACDASSEPVILEDLASAYNGTLAEEPCAQYADYAAWQYPREVIARDEELAWWKQQLTDMNGPGEFQSDFARPQSDLHKGASVSLQLDAATLEKCKALARASNTTVFTLLLAAFDTLLYRYTGVEYVIVGTPVAVRNHHSAESMVGLFINTLLLRTCAAGNPTFREFLERVRETVAGGLTHQEVPFDAVIDALRPQNGGIAGSPLFHVMFEYRNVRKPYPAMKGLAVERIEFDRGVTPFDLTLDLEPGDEGVRGHVYYNTCLFEHATIERLARHFERLLVHVIVAPDEKVAAIPLLTPAERQQLLVEWNATERAYPRETSLAELVEAQVERTPDAVAIVCGEQSLTYRDLNARANQLACELRKRGAGPDQLVGLCVERSVEMIVALLAIVKAGAAYLPLDPLLPIERLGYMLEDSCVRVLISEQSLLGLLKSFAGTTILLEDAGWQANLCDNKMEKARHENLAYLIYTSGSTGKPKGVQVPRGALTNLLWSMLDWLQLTERDRLLAVTTISFDIAGADVWLPLLVGAQTVIASREQAADGNALRSLLERHDITFLQATPVTWRLLLDAGWCGKPDMQTVCTGEAMRQDLAAQLVPAVKRLWNLYGPTETTIWSTGYSATDGRGPILIGRPVANTRCYILDEHRQPVPIGVTGELYIGGDGLARGYLSQPELTAEKFMADPFLGAGARIYRTGDLARYRADGNIECLARIDNQVKIRGYRIELGEIEAALREQPEISQAMVSAREDELGDKQLVAYLVAATGLPAPASSLVRRRLEKHLPGYMVPTAYVFLERLPISLNGKIDRKALPSPEVVAGHPDEEEFLAPATPVERQLAGIWEEVLHREPIGIRENFFDIGGHSLSAMRVMARVRGVFDLEIPVSSLFQSPTIETLAMAIDGMRSSTLSEEDLLRILEEIEAMPTSEAEGQ